MAARMPACYAAVYKVLEEVSMRLPLFNPESMLDFGSGPGTAIWAAHEVPFHACLVASPICNWRVLGHVQQLFKVLTPRSQFLKV